MKNLFQLHKNPKTQKITPVFLNKFKVKEADTNISSKLESYQAEEVSLQNKIGMKAVFKALALFPVPFLSICLFLLLPKDSRFYLLGCLGMFLINVIAATFFVIIFRKANKEKLFGEEALELKKKIKSLQESAAFSLNIPLTAYKTDIFCHLFILKENQKPSSLNTITYLQNTSCHVFKKENSLCFSLYDGLYSIPISSIKEFYIFNTPMIFQDWNKPEKPDDEKYAKFNIKYPNMFSMTVKDTSHLVCQLDGEEYEIVFPPYETKIIEELIGITATPKKK